MYQVDFATSQAHPTPRVVFVIRKFMGWLDSFSGLDSGSLTNLWSATGQRVVSDVLGWPFSHVGSVASSRLE